MMWPFLACPETNTCQSQITRNLDGSHLSITQQTTENSSLIPKLRPAALTAGPPFLVDRSSRTAQLLILRGGLLVCVTYYYYFSELLRRNISIFLTLFVLVFGLRSWVGLIDRRGKQGRKWWGTAGQSRRPATTHLRPSSRKRRRRRRPRGSAKTRRSRRRKGRARLLWRHKLRCAKYDLISSSQLPHVFCLELASHLK